MVVRPGWVATKMTTGLAPGPMATTPDAVAADVVTGLGQGATVVWSPAAAALHLRRPPSPARGRLAPDAGLRTTPAAAPSGPRQARRATMFSRR